MMNTTAFHDELFRCGCKSRSATSIALYMTVIQPSTPCTSNSDNMAEPMLSKCCLGLCQCFGTGNDTPSTVWVYSPTHVNLPAMVSSLHRQNMPMYCESPMHANKNVKNRIKI